MTAAIGQDEAASFFMAEAPRGLNADLLRLVFAAYPMAFEQAEQFPFEEAHDLRPHIRRAAIEASLATLPAKQVLTVTTRRNSSGNAFHKELFFGRVVLTHSTIAAPESRIREAQFRQSLARSCNLPMFIEFADAAPDDDGLLWAVLVHGPADDQRAPAFVRIAFPLPDGSHSFDLDLVGRDAVGEVPPVGRPDIREPEPVLRPDIEEQADHDELGS